MRKRKCLKLKPQGGGGGGGGGLLIAQTIRVPSYGEVGLAKSLHNFFG